MVCADTGGAPNIGANDGACICPLGWKTIRDFRPSVQLACALLFNRRAYPEGIADTALKWLELQIPEREMDRPASSALSESGMVILRPEDSRSWGVVHMPRYRYRPSHADALHFDLWVSGQNLLRDAGTYSYAAQEPWDSYFPGTSAHNTVQLDGRDQMPLLSRFLFGSWIRRKKFSGIDEEGGELAWSGSYQDRFGGMHKRTVVTRSAGAYWQIEDHFSGHKERAVLRWRLMPGRWALDGMQLSGEGMSVELKSSREPVRVELVTGFESLVYLERGEVPVLEAEFPVGETTVVTTLDVHPGARCA
jgi:hypothetical protein